MSHDEPTLTFDPAVLARWDRPGPRYTSYPTAPCLDEGFDEAAYRAQAAQNRRLQGQEPISLYVHLPFCEHLCFFCGCNKIVSHDRDRIDRYLDHLELEMERERDLHGARPVEQLHWGGGSPTWLDESQRERLMSAIRGFFPIPGEDQAEVSIEADPRHLEPGAVRGLRALGFNRISFGVQDFDPSVQEAVNRIQPAELSLRALQEARDAGYLGTSVDLIHGLPGQTVPSFAETVTAVAEAGPDRISVFAYAHLPQMFKPQRCIDASIIPTPDVKRELFRTAVEILTGSGYLALGMDHFVRADDELAVAARQGTMHRNFQGYSTRADRDLIALGASAIGRTSQAYWQKEKHVPSWERLVAEGALPVVRGIALTAEDGLRRRIITEIMCQMKLDFAPFEAEGGFDFRQRFARELALLAPMRDEGLVALDASGLRVQPLGRFVIKTIAGAFDGRTSPFSGAVQAAN
ncbi:MAG: oxygen-independent coproporphyrinogen III oxidase [Planctomycetes bacterium]|nr:oxygen-independent coproporphyrinogen III oxidase [Planctomycetota bacterium]